MTHLLLANRPNDHITVCSDNYSIKKRCAVGALGAQSIESEPISIFDLTRSYRDRLEIQENWIYIFSLRLGAGVGREEVGGVSTYIFPEVCRNDLHVVAIDSYQDDALRIRREIDGFCSAETPRAPQHWHIRSLLFRMCANQ